MISPREKKNNKSKRKNSRKRSFQRVKKRSTMRSSRLKIKSMRLSRFFSPRTVDFTRFNQSKTDKFKILRTLTMF